MRLSQIYQLTYTQPELDFVDIDPAADQPLFIDPYAFATQTDDWSVTCNNAIVSFFQVTIDSIRAGDEDFAKALLSNLHEPNETCLGLSTQQPQGRGVSGQQALDLYDKLADSEAVQTGLLSEISECELLVPGISRDKISDITTNIIRRQLIEYTQIQCRLHGIRLLGTVASGPLWDPEQRQWTQEYTELPIVNDRKILLVPKASVRRRITFSHQEYYNHFVLNFLAEDHLQRPHSNLVRILKNGTRRVTKEALKIEYPLSKEFLFTFTREHPQVLDEYKRAKSTSPPLSTREIEQDFDEEAFAEAIISQLRQIQPGTERADNFHKLMIGTLEFIFYPNLIYPKKEDPIHGGRKRIDITYTNNATGGFFYRVPTVRRIIATKIMVECKNYSCDPGNPELDQLSGRFSNTRGLLGLLVARTFSNRDLFLARCRDTARDGRGYIIPFVDTDIIHMLESIGSGRRDDVDRYIDGIFDQLLR